MGKTEFLKRTKGGSRGKFRQKFKMLGSGPKFFSDPGDHRGAWDDGRFRPESCLSIFKKSIKVLFRGENRGKYSAVTHNGSGVRFRVGTTVRKRRRNIRRLILPAGAKRSE